MVTAIEPTAGTDEAEWAAWLPGVDWPRLDLTDLAGRPVVVLAAHPDDEVLGAGGLLHLVARNGGELHVVWATDGEASHPGSTSPVVPQLPVLRRQEAAEALAVLGLEGATGRHLGLPDGGLVDREDELAALLHPLVPSDALLLAPWSGDGHPDHEAVGRVARSLGSSLGSPVLEYPVWTWSWARPDDLRVPWDRARRVELDGPALAAKAAATGCFRTQVEPIGPGPLDGPVVPDRVLAHFRRDVEVVLA